MGKTLKITDVQLGRIANLISETNANVLLKRKIFNFLDKDYEAIGGVKKLGNEFHGTNLIRKKIDGQLITPMALSDYLSHIFNGLSRESINDSISSWYYGDFDFDTGMRVKK